MSSQIKNKDLSLIENQIGCGYCANEKGCVDRDPKLNKAKLGCDFWIHHSRQKESIWISANGPAGLPA